MLEDRESNEQHASKLNAPIPVKGPGNLRIGPDRPSTLVEEDNEGANLRHNTKSFDFGSKKEHRTQMQPRRPSYSVIEKTREEYYNLDYPYDAAELERLQLDPKSRFFARNRPRTMNLPKLLPYETELPRDKAKFLSHIVSHLYIAVQSLDIQGSLSITAKDLASLKNISGLSDIELALDTNLFEVNTSNTTDLNVDDDMSNEFLDDFYDSDSEYDDDFDDNFDEDEEEETTVQHKKSPKSAAIVSVRIWTHELLVWLKMKYDMPLSLRASLARVYYAICLCRGQSINVKLYVRTFELLTHDIRLLQQQGLELDWKNLCAELENHFPSADSSLDHFEKKEHKYLVRLAERASNFISNEALPEIYSKFGSKFSISHASLVFSSLSLLPLTYTEGGMEDQYDIRYYLSSFFAFWHMLTKSSGVESHLTSRLGKIAMSAMMKVSNDPEASKYLILGKSGVFTEDQIRYVFATLMNSLSIMDEKYFSLKCKFFHGYASMIIYSINGDSCLEEAQILDQFYNLLNAIESYVHPSNSGEWSRPISKLVLSFVYQFHKRYNQENQEEGDLFNLPEESKLSDIVIMKFIDMLLPVLKTGIQSKKGNVSSDYLTCFYLLAQLKPRKVIEYVLLDIFESLEGVISTHRVSVALRLMSEIARPFIATPIIRVHLTRLLLLALPGIDSNDLSKTMLTLNLFSVVANYVPIYDLTAGEGDETLAMQFTQDHLEFLQGSLYEGGEASAGDFEVDGETEKKALESSTTAFKVIMKNFCERIFMLIENLPDPSKSSGIERHLGDAIPKFLYVILESLSDDIFHSIRDSFFDFVMNNVYYSVADVVAEICRGLIKREPCAIKQYISPMIDRIKEDIEENDAGSSRTGVDIIPRDQALFWNLVILNECVGNACEYVVDLRGELMDLSFYLMENVKGPVVFASSYLLNQMLQTTTVIKLQECRLISPAYQKKYGVSEKCWGGFLHDSYRFSDENLEFKWFLPSDREVLFAVECFRSHVSRCLRNILILMQTRSTSELKDIKSKIKITDDLRLNFLYLSYAISGISYLLDPSFNEEIPKISQHSTQPIQQRLLLLNQIRGTDTKLSAGDENYWENLHENLSKIVDDLENMENEKLEDKDISGLEDNNDLDEDREEIGESMSKANVFNESISHISKDATNFVKSNSPPTSIDESNRATPNIEGLDTTSMNPGITFRERKLYTSKYFFGDDIENRRSNETYLKLHRSYYLIGKSLHSICKYLIQNFHDNTKLFKHFLYVMNMWFSDVGKELLLDHSHARISFDYVSSIQRINRIRKPYTRIALGTRIEAYHNLRVALHATSRSMSELDKLLLEDLVKLSVSTYSAISKSAQATLVDAMKRINGSYNVIIHSTFKHIYKSLEEKDHKKIASGLRIFGLRRVRNKLHNDYLNLERYVDVLHRCLDFDDYDVQDLAQSLYKGIYNGIAPPSSVCLINSFYVDSIRPPDEFIDLEVKAVRLAKERKRKIYFERISKLEDCVFGKAKRAAHWKITLLNLCLLINLQQDLEISLRQEAFQIIAKEASSGHPTISRLAIKGITNLINKLYVLQLFDCNLKNVYDINFVPIDQKIIDTNPHEGQSFYQLWMKEMSSLDPKYFIDQRPYVGWLFWDSSRRALKQEESSQLVFSKTDMKALEALTSSIDYHWLEGIVSLWITENEANSAFQGADVFFIASIFFLIAAGHIENIKFEEIMNLIKSLYVKEEKGSHIVVCEIASGYLLSSKFNNEVDRKHHDQMLSSFLEEIFAHDLTPDNRGVWNIFSWWIPSHVDCRRFPKTRNVVTDFSSQYDSAIYATRLSYLRSYIAVVTWNFSDSDRVLKLCLENINHKYQGIRDQIGSLLAILSFAYFKVSFADFKELATWANKSFDIIPYGLKHSKLLEKLAHLFEQIEAWRSDIDQLPIHEVLTTNYVLASSTVLTWLSQALNTSASVQFQDIVESHIVPFLLRLINLKEVCQLASIEPLTVFKMVSQISYSNDKLERIVSMLDELGNEHLTVVQSIVVGEFTETFYFKNLLKLTKLQRKRIIIRTDKLLYNQNAEIREAAASTLSGLFHIEPPSESDETISESMKKYTNDLDRIRKKYRSLGYNKLKVPDSIILHAATLGLGAIINAFPYISPPPPWIPEILSVLATKSSGLPGIIGKTAKETLGQFKKNRQDTWHIDSQVFSESQIENLEGVLWKSYFV